MKKIFTYIFTLFLTVVALGACKPNVPESVTLHIVHTNDTHSQVDPASDTKHGGMVERASIIEMLREKYPDLIYLDAGDMVQGSAYFNVFQGELEMKAMNLQQLKASTFGNHEFDNGIDFLVNMLKQANHQLVNCNFDCSETALAPYVKKYIIIEQQNVKIGITGVTCDPNHLIFNRNWKGIKYTEASEAANKQAAELREMGCDLVILLSHTGYYEKTDSGDIRIARRSKDIDLIIGGHSHCNIENGIAIENAEGRNVWITQTGAKTEPIGHVAIDLKLNPSDKRQYEIADIRCEKMHPEELDLSNYGASIRELLAPYKDSLSAKMCIPIGHAAKTLIHDRPQSPLSNIVADLLLEMEGELYGQPMDIAIMNIGGIRKDLSAGIITIGDMYETFPFENTLFIIELKGSDLKALIESIAGKGLEGLSGVEIVLQTINNRTTATSIKVGGKPIDPNKIYKVATIDYLAEGNDGLTALTRGVKFTNTGVLIRDAFTSHVKKLEAQGKMLDGNVDNRVIVKK